MFHEFTEVMGRIRDGNISAFYTPLDLFAFTSSGVRVPDVRGGYFSVDGGVTNLSTPNVFASSGDAGDWSGAALDACNSNLTTGVILPFSSYDKQTLDALGWMRTFNPNRVAAGRSGGLRGRF